MRLRLGNKHHLRKPANRKAQIRKAFVPLTGLICAFDLQVFSGGVYSPSATSRTISFSISNSFWYYRKRGSASYIVREVLSVRERERERYRETERERDGSDVTIVALKLAMNSHFHLPKIRTIGDELTLSLAKNSHFSFLPSHFPSLPSRRGHHCGAEIHNQFTLSIAKNFFALFVPPLSNGTSRTTSDRKPKTNDQILPSPILFFPSKN